MPGTIYPDSLILYNQYPPPREVFDALMGNGFMFIGSGPFHAADLWFLKKVLCVIIKRSVLTIDLERLIDKTVKRANCDTQLTVR